jgi:hypothetical protein
MVDQMNISVTGSLAGLKNIFHHVNVITLPLVLGVYP